MAMGVKGPKVIVIGGGLGGLCLAQGLTQRGMEVRVIERDEDVLGPGQGYKASIDARGLEALRQTLPDDLFNFLKDVAMVRGDSGPTSYAILDHTMKVLNTMDIGGEGGVMEIDHRLLRDVLLCGLQEKVTFGTRFEGYMELPNKGLLVELNNGKVDECDILVGADGYKSKVREQAQGQELQMSKRGVVFGRTSMTDSSVLGSPLLELLKNYGGVMAIGRGGNHFFFATSIKYENPHEVARKHKLQLHGHGLDDYITWGLLSGDEMTEELYSSPSRLLDVALAKLDSNFDQSVASVARNCDELDTTWRSFCDGYGVIPVAKPVGLTFIGDALYSPPPFGSLGASAALSSASLLVQHLTLIDKEKNCSRNLVAYEIEALNEASARVPILNKLHVPIKWSVISVPFKGHLLRTGTRFFLNHILK